MVSTEKPVPSWQAASAAAIFMGCCLNINWAWAWPEKATPAKATIATTAPMRKDFSHTVWSSLSRPAPWERSSPTIT